MVHRLCARFTKPDRHARGRLRLSRLMLVALLLPGCASIVKGTTQSINVLTEPAGAAWDLTRDGKRIAGVATTPDSVSVDKSMDDISIACRKADHEETTVSLESSASGWTAGNIIFGLLGGPIALGIDVASGAMTEYPASVTVVLFPAKFSTAAERDVFYGGKLADLHARAALGIDHIKATCNKKPRTNCEKRITEAKALESAEAAELERKRGRAVIDEPST
ncbi:MAG TPA: hypothetical protein VFZ03_06750 [Dongiaceae bacterium]